jgi:PTH1 family peptidyl-tRNA hydrolase
LGDGQVFLIVGLGNPGKEYDKTRHNVGYDVVDRLAGTNSIKVDRIKFKALTGEGTIAGKRVMLMKPLTYMNNSGIALREAMEYYKLSVEDLMVIVDDIDIEFGTTRIRKKGSAGSHNGMKSIIYHLKRDDFTRIKLGIGKKPPEWDLADFVLSRFSTDERREVDKMVIKAAEAVEAILKDGIDAAMNSFNIKNTAQD